MTSSSSFIRNDVIKEETEEMRSIAEQSQEIDTTKLIDVDLSLFISDDGSAGVKKLPEKSSMEGSKFEYNVSVTNDSDK